MKPVDRILEQLSGLKQRNGYWMALCPAHHDHHPSLSIKEGEGGKPLVYCHAGCSFEQVMDAIGHGERLAPVSERGTQRRQEVRRSRPTHPSKVWEVRDQTGELKGYHLRYDNSDGDKDCLWQRPNGEWGLNGTPLYQMPLYRAEFSRDWAQDVPVIVTEGEKAADALARVYPAVLGTVTGAASTPGREALEPLKGRTVILWPDNDDAGRAHMERVAEGLRGVAQEVRIFEWTEAPPQGDAADHPVVSSQSQETFVELFKTMTASPIWDLDPVGVMLSAVEPEEVRWLWERRIPLGKLTVVDGNPGDGKSVLMTDLAARVSKGRGWPDGAQCILGGALICSAEDGVADTIVPRAVAAGGDLSRVLALSTVPDGENNERPLSIPEDLPLIERGIRRVGAILVVVDPLMAFLSGDANAHKDQDVRRAMAPLAKMAERTGAAVVLVRHLNKTFGMNPLYRGGGSIGIIGAARSGLVVGRHPHDEDLRVLAGMKSNLSLPPESLIYRIETAANGAARVVYEGTTETNARELLKEPAHEERSAFSDAKEFLVAELEDGPMTAKQINRNAKETDVAERTLRRAKDALGVVSTKEADGSWTWSLPPKEVEGGQTPTDGHLGHVGNLAKRDRENSAYVSEDGQGGQDRDKRSGITAPGKGTMQGICTKDQRTECCIHGFPDGKGCYLCDPYHPQRTRGQLSDK
jgi:putative DNA primase/helicase